jgi:hypothetical protein
VLRNTAWWYRGSLVARKKQVCSARRDHLTRGSFRPTVLALVAIVFLSACGDADETASTDAELEQVQRGIKQRLEQLRSDSVTRNDFEVEYSDMHAFHGGEILTVRGKVLTGRYLSRNEAMLGEISPPPKTLTTEQLRAFVDLLLDLEAWEQRVPSRTAVLDESSASLTITVGELQSFIWEWYNDLHGNERMVRVKEMLEEIAGPVPNG